MQGHPQLRHEFKATLGYIHDELQAAWATEEDPKDEENNGDVFHRIQSVEHVSQTVQSLNCISQDPTELDDGG